MEADTVTLQVLSNIIDESLITSNPASNGSPDKLEECSQSVSQPQ